MGANDYVASACNEKMSPPKDGDLDSEGVAENASDRKQFAQTVIVAVILHAIQTASMTRQP
jgi:hypothetical protein